MNKKINCKHNDRGAWCTCTKVKKSIFGLGARLCTEYYESDNTCEFQVKHPRPKAPPPPPLPFNIQTPLVPRMKEVKVCSKMCDDCPFSKKSIRGFLATYTIDQIQQYITSSVFFVCHKYIKADMDNDSCMKAVLNGELPMCRGYMECMVKSAIVPRNADLAVIRSVIKHELSDDSMSMMEFRQHHDLLYSPKPFNPPVKKDDRE